jgi:hypothetical protein
VPVQIRQPAPPIRVKVCVPCLATWKC